MTKDTLAGIYKLSPSSLRVLLNDRYFPELQKVGYKKDCQILSPKVLRKFIELYDLPFDKNEFNPL